jgi:hypothetical protein
MALSGVKPVPIVIEERKSAPVGMFCRLPDGTKVEEQDAALSNEDQVVHCRDPQSSRPYLPVSPGSYIQTANGQTIPKAKLGGPNGKTYEERQQYLENKRKKKEAALLAGTSVVSSPCSTVRTDVGDSPRPMSPSSSRETFSQASLKKSPYVQHGEERPAAEQVRRLI